MVPTAFQAVLTAPFITYDNPLPAQMLQFCNKTELHDIFLTITTYPTSYFKCSYMLHLLQTIVYSQQ